MRVRLPLAALMLLPLLGACGGKGEVTMPPLTPEPGDSQLADTSTTLNPKETLPARAALYKYLRGIGAGNAKACAYLAPEYEQRVFGAPGRCREKLGPARAKLRPQDVAALRGVTVPTCEEGPDEGNYVVRFADLKWKGEPARPGGLLAASFTLRKTGDYWQIVG
ncbi:hypothetical protein E1293_35630 [Actinomadura darangshiensis]|uniref:Nuclear transport factor 2 family protein n=1 Tax=Actinomadura darangshiensis TaxID=705336 RepID=A0A4R5AEL8_9ACTN|nr:hypothetical protein [Actinomadura darangshiensis]TDD69599.1 hypothetical protein E1293_35630 [Actinomadura darangshiensis]